MVGRAAQGNPWALAQIMGSDEDPSREEVVAELLLFIRETVRELGEQRATGFLKKFYAWYLGRGRFPKPFKQELVMLPTIEEVETRLLAAAPGAVEVLERLEARDPAGRRGAARLAADLGVRRRLTLPRSRRGGREDRIDGEREVHRVAVPVLAGGGGDAEVRAGLEERVGAARRGRWNGWDLVSPRVAEAQVVVDGVAALVDETVVAAAEQQQVGERGLAAERPVLDVVRVDVDAVVTAGEAAAVVACEQGPAKRGRDRTRLPSDAERLSRPLVQSDEGGVAGEPARGLGSERGPVGEQAGALACSPLSAASSTWTTTW